MSDGPSGTSPEDFYLSALIRSQLRLAISVAAGFMLLLLLIATLISFWPQIHEIRLLEVPLPWLLLGVGLYPIILIAAALFNRASQRNEEHFRDLHAGTDHTPRPRDVVPGTREQGKP